MYVPIPSRYCSSGRRQMGSSTFAHPKVCISRKDLKEIQDGTFAKEWVSVYEKEGQKSFQKYMDALEAHQVEKVGKKLRKMMWPNDQVT